MRFPVALAYLLFTALPIIQAINLYPEIRHETKVHFWDNGKPFSGYYSQPIRHKVGEKFYDTRCTVYDDGHVYANNPFPVQCYAAVIQYPKKRTAPPMQGNMMPLGNQNMKVAIPLTYLKPEEGSTENQYSIVYYFHPDDYELLKK
ncbi:uncharacterized protein PGTG_09586 [Puccinia graminis f. sp. tritici CRL 75-36-700-3]|uniref:Uncharacterized protein n=1 Tax=Puccinia graminis f. sp. tritici (strain CRL 75-36-700-3 / race SCCL) TaxID=418459 RepID=E3KHU8_PUCGT|nr:uncharacterized protein PGTG_09586 [Puccinia graminis f. sp. tritici CRL 75-36-700-3]EFP83873.2 hypothetical protein PGTG_09586 [Puccinia graminis f. sp. tritici CRL 75-36-700-3]